MTPRISTIHLRKLTAHFTTLPNELLRDKSLSFKSRGVLAFMLSHADGWEATAEWITEQGQEGREAIRSAIRELEATGYAVHAVRRDDNGQIVTNVWTWHSQPVPMPHRSNRTRWDANDEILKSSERAETTGSRITVDPQRRNYGKPCDGKPSDGFQPVQKDHGKNNHLEEVPAPAGADLFSDFELPDAVTSKKTPRDEQLERDEKVQAIYKAYPRHKQPVPARRAIAKAIKKIGFDKLLAATTKYADYCRAEKKDPDFIPYPATWFNAGSWDDKDDTTHDERTRKFW